MLVHKDIARDRLEVRESDETWIDVSVPVRSGMLHWPGDPEVVITQTKHLRHGHAATVSLLSLGAHSGTHVDAPNHFILDAAGVDAFRLERLIGPARVIDFGELGQIHQTDLERQGIRAGDRLLFKTRNSGFWKEKEFRADYTYLVPEAAQWLAERGVRTVGIDYLSIGSPDSGAETHRPLLAAGICIIEGVDLSSVGPGLYDLICLPLRLDGIDGAPARVVLRRSPLAEIPRSREGRTS